MTINETDTVLPFIYAESDEGAATQVDSFTKAIVEHEESKYSGEDRAKPQTAESAAEPNREWRDSFLEALESSRPLIGEKERAAIDEARARSQERKETAEAEREKTEEPPAPSPLDAFESQDVKRWAEHFGLTSEDIQNPRVAAMLANQMQSASEEPAGNAVEAPSTGPMEEQQFQAHLEGLHRLANDESINSPQMMRVFASGLAECLGADTEESMQNVHKLSQVLAQSGISLVSTLVPRILAHYLPTMVDQFLPGIADAHRESTVNRIWADVRASEPGFRELPDYSEEPDSEFQQLRAEVLEKNQWMSTITFKDAQGRDLHPDHPASMIQASRLFARVARGEQFTPEKLQALIEKGRTQAKSHSRRVTASRAMRGGRSSGASFQATKGDEFRDAIVNYMRDQRSTSEE